jgi:hypothetical protein
MITVIYGFLCFCGKGEFSQICKNSYPFRKNFWLNLNFVLVKDLLIQWLYRKNNLDLVEKKNRVLHF